MIASTNFSNPQVPSTGGNSARHQERDDSARVERKPTYSQTGYGKNVLVVGDGDSEGENKITTTKTLRHGRGSS